MDPVLYAVLPGKEDVVNLGVRLSPLYECARKHKFSVQVVESPNFKECRRVSIVVETVFRRGPGAPESLGDVGERLVSRGPDMDMESEQKERECALALAKEVETVATNGLLSKVWRRWARS